MSCCLGAATGLQHDTEASVALLWTLELGTARDHPPAIIQLLHVWPTEISVHRLAHELHIVHILASKTRLYHRTGAAAASRTVLVTQHCV